MGVCAGYINPPRWLKPPARRTDQSTDPLRKRSRTDSACTVGFSLAGASDSQSGANVVLRGAPSILRKRSIRSKRQCEHCRSCCVYAVGLSIALYAVPVARATAADLSMLRIPPPRCVGGGLAESGGGCSCKCLCACVCVCVCMGFRLFFVYAHQQRT